MRTGIKMAETEERLIHFYFFIIMFEHGFAANLWNRKTMLQDVEEMLGNKMVLDHCQFGCLISK